MWSYGCQKIQERYYRLAVWRLGILQATNRGQLIRCGDSESYRILTGGQPKAYASASSAARSSATLVLRISHPRGWTFSQCSMRTCCGALTNGVGASVVCPPWKRDLHEDM